MKTDLMERSLREPGVDVADVVEAGAPPGLTLFDAPALSPRAERAHAMKNCLSVIRAVAALVEGELSAKSRERMERLKDASHRLQVLLSDDLCAEPKSVEHVSAPTCCIASLVREVAARLSDRAEHAAVQLSTRCPGGLLSGDPAALQEALFNLVANAIEATRPGGHVLLSTHVTSDDDHLWTVEDSGGGMHAEQLRVLGRAFCSTRQGGSGIGLAFARKVVSEHGGMMHIESTVGSGTIVSLWLPTRRHPTAAPR